MIPLKRLLNHDDDADTFPRRTGPRWVRDIQEDSRQKSKLLSCLPLYLSNINHRDKPSLEDQSWPELFGDLLGSEYNHGDVRFDTNGGEFIYDPLSCAEDSIEAWAAHNLPALDSYASAEPQTDHPTSAELAINISEQLCYGMVCFLSLAFVLCRRRLYL